MSDILQNLADAAEELRELEAQSNDKAAQVEKARKDIRELLGLDGSRADTLPAVIGREPDCELRMDDYTRERLIALAKKIKHNIQEGYKRDAYGNAEALVLLLGR